MLRCLPFIMMLVLTVPDANAEIYRCESDGQVTYSDRACAPGAEPEPEPFVNTYEAGEVDDLAGAYRKRTEAAKRARDRADKEWLKAHKTRREREARIRSGLLNDEVVAGMNAAQVRHVFGEPDRVTRQDKGGVVKETWTWRRGKESRTVNFKDGEVISASRRKGGKKAE